MKKLCFVICYFGKLPNTMQITLNTCKTNPDFDWLLFTDDRSEYDYPQNVNIKYCSFEEMISRFQRCFDFEIAIKQPLKFCDFKPAYGYIFSEELKDYAYWGHCDLDQFFGNLSHFLTDEYLTKYDKIFTLGHMTIYRNEKRCNELFLSNNFYREVFSTEKRYGFDEWGNEQHPTINNIAEANGLRICGDNPMFDVGPFASEYICSIYDLANHKWNVDREGSTIATWQNGDLFAHTGGGGDREILYIHIQKRKLRIKQKCKRNTMVFYPNTILVGEEITEKLISKIFKKVFIRKFFKVDETRQKKQLKRKFKHLFERLTIKSQVKF